MHEPNQSNTKRGFPALIVLLAVVLVAALSFVPWGRLTNDFIKDFDLLADLHPSTSEDDDLVDANMPIDPELDKAIAEMKADSAIAPTQEPVSSIEIIEGEYIPERVNGILPIEDYTVDKRGLKRLKSAIGSGSARIAMMGDSYIEGDIFSQDVRDMLQEAYGGRGVGYMPPHSQVAGFRRSANVQGTNWTNHKLDKGSNPYFTIIGEYFTADGNASTKYSGLKSNPRLQAWATSSILFIAPKAGTITLISDNDTLSVNVEPSPQPQLLTLDGETSHFTVKTAVPGLVFLGAWLQDKNGVTVDCMSIRGDSGITHRRINTELTQQTRPYIDYDLIILEYGINALSAKQKNYSSYASLMQEVVARIRQCYPSADILMLGVGDRGQKINGEVHSLPTIDAMIQAQRQCAQKAGVLFWDTRQAMGGKDAIVDWRDRKLVNGDYIHLNSAGGKALAKELVPAIRVLIDK